MDKIKNLPALRLVAFAVAVAILLGLSSVMFSFTASAETADDVVSQLGTLGNYDCIKFKAGQKIDFMTLYNRAHSFSSTYVFGAIFGYKDGKFTSFTNNGVSVVPSSDGVYKDIVFCTRVMYGSWLLGDKSQFDTVYAQFGVYQSNYCSMWIGVKNNEPSIQGTVKLASSSQDFYDANGNTMYLVFTGSNSSWGTQQQNDFRNDIINNLTADNYKDSDTGSEPSASEPSAKFVTCASFTREDGSLPLWFKDFTADGLQYPMFTYFISDNGNKHRYQMRLSYSSSQTDVVNTIFGLVNENNLSDQEKSLRELGQFLKGNLPVGSSNYTKFMALKPYMELILKKPEYISFDEAFSLNSNSMNFETSVSSGNKVYTICLSDYSDIVANYIYRAQLVDMQTSVILDTTYFCSNKTYYKGDSGTGAKIYDYGDDYNGMIEDIKNNTPSVTPGIDNKFSTTGDIIDIQDNNYLSGLKIDNIFSVLGQSASSIGAFFQACLNIVPSAILSLLLSTLSLLIVLRVLGR